ncbi:MAG: hypothetical protein ACRD01_04625 [Terriglobales bacterium]
MGRTLEIRCPDCGARLQVDAETGLVLGHQRAPSRGRDLDLSRAQEQLGRQEQERERRFQQSVADEKGRDELLARKFEQSLEQAKRDPATGKPLRDFDLD